MQKISHWISRVKRKKMATREEELQKKREEAERKARRGEIDPTHEFTFQVNIFLVAMLSNTEGNIIEIMFSKI